MVNAPDDIGRKELLKSAYRKIEELRARLAAGEERRSEPVAIVGVGCRFPGGVADLESFWQLLSSGRDATTEIPLERWKVDDYYDSNPDAPNKMYVRRGGFIDNVRGFDPLFFHVSPLEATSMDPQQRVLLEVTWEALENAGQAPDKLAGSRTGVFIGISANDFAMMTMQRMHEKALETHAATGMSPSITAGHISYFLGLRGPCMAIDTACSSALTSIHLALQSLRRGESTMALAGAVNLILSPDGSILVCKARMLAPDGRCKTFDAAADGYARSEGCAIVVLKLLSQAQADGDRILALIHGSACNQDGRTNGITAPNGNAQREVVQAALTASGLSAHDIDYVETHGTGTSLGDPIEVQALAEVFAPNRPVNRKVVLGAVKSNIGHLEPTAGMAAITKVIVALQHGQIPPNLHFNNPNPLIPWDSLPFSVPTRLTPWTATAGRRLAGVSAFGFSGTNVHMILEQAPAQPLLPAQPDRPCHLLALSAQSPRALSELAARYIDFLKANPYVNLADVCSTANAGRSHFAHRLAFIAAGTEELRAQLEQFVQRASNAAAAKASAVSSQAPQVGLIVATSGLHEHHRQLDEQSTVFRDAIDACDSVAMELFGVSVAAAVRRGPAWSESPSVDSILEFALGYATAALWRDWGLNPAAISGCGAGRYAAAAFVGAMSLHEALRLAVDPHAADRMPINWSAPQTTLLSSSTGLPLTSDWLRDPSESKALAEPPAEMSELLAGFLREGVRVVLALDVVSTQSAQFEQKSALPLTFIMQTRDGWSGLLEAVGRVYRSGVSINWQRFEAPWRRQRLALPTYPFQRQECWPQSRPAATVRKSLLQDVHPLLGRRLHAPQFGDAIVFELELNLGRVPLLEDHRFFSTIVVPATAMLEMGTAAGRIALRQRAVLLSDFTIEQPLLLEERQARLVQTVLTPEDDGGYSFVIRSAEIGKLEQGATWKRHCSGKLTTAVASLAPVDPESLHRLRTRYDEPVDPDWFYGTLVESGVEYGPSFRLMRWIGRGENGTLVHLQLPTDLAKQSPGYGVHPGLLDAAVQTLGIAYRFDPVQLERKELYMPVAVERYRLSVDGPSEMWCHAAVRPGTVSNEETFIGDVELYTAGSQLIGEIRGIHFKRIVKKHFVQEMAEWRLTNWLYETRWESLPALTPAARIGGTWLILADRNPTADEFAGVIRARAGRAILVRAGENYSQQGRDGFTMRFDTAADYDSLLQATVSESPPRVVYFATSRRAETDADQGVPRMTGSIAAQLLQLTQALARNGAGDLAALAVVTEGFQTPSIGIRSSLAASSAWGFGRTIIAELPDLRCKLIDVERSVPAGKAAEQIADELASESTENQVGLGDAKRLGLRLTRADSSQFDHEQKLGTHARSAVELEIGSRGDFRQLRFVPQQPRPPAAGEVQLRVLATAMNFRDVLNVLGMYPGDPGAVGVECVGEIIALGPDVSGWSVGDQVLAIPHRGYCTYANAPVTMIFRRPPNLSLAEAATILMAYLTAAYSLYQLGRMKRGDRVLIHAAAGGVGLAAVQLALQTGAEIFATAGSPAKREYLRQLGAPHVMDSRSLEFATTVRELTGGQGIDLVLNSLTGPAIAAGLSLLRAGGSFLEIGKNELLNAEQSAAVNALAHYHVVDLLPPFRQTPEVMQRLFANITDSLAKGTIRALPYRTFNLPDATQAFRYMASAKHIGKIVVIDHSAVTTALEPSGMYLITGGMGGLGLSVARGLVAQGARRILLVGRSAPSAAAKQAIRDLEALGAQITVAQADVADRQQLADLLHNHTSVISPLRGVIHAAGLLDDGALLLQDWSRFTRVLRPKIDGAWNLHELTLQMPLEFFVLFSSGAGLFGNPGQTSYVTANVFLDQLAVARQAAGLPALSINWGPWSEVGMAAAMNERFTKGWDSRGLSSIDPDQGLSILHMLLAQSQIAQIAALPIEDSSWRRKSGQPVAPLVRGLVDAAEPTGDAIPVDNALATQRLRLAAPNEKRTVLIELIAELIVDIFGFDRSRSIPIDQNLTTLGMDSLLAIQLSNRLKTSFATAIPSTLTFQYPTIEAIADYLMEHLTQTDEQSQPGEAQQLLKAVNAGAGLGQQIDSHQAQTILANLDQLSNRAIETLLDEIESDSSSA